MSLEEFNFNVIKPKLTFYFSNNKNNTKPLKNLTRNVIN
jgi:hypothetical protein